MSRIYRPMKHKIRKFVHIMSKSILKSGHIISLSLGPRLELLLLGVGSYRVFLPLGIILTFAYFATWLAFWEKPAHATKYFISYSRYAFVEDEFQIWYHIYGEAGPTPICLEVSKEDQELLQPPDDRCLQGPTGSKVFRTRRVYSGPWEVLERFLDPSMNTSTIKVGPSSASLKVTIFHIPKPWVDLARSVLPFIGLLCISIGILAFLLPPEQVEKMFSFLHR